MTYEEVLALSKERMGIFGYYPHEIEKAAKACYKELVEEKMEKEIHSIARILPSLFKFRFKMDNSEFIV